MAKPEQKETIAYVILGLIFIFLNTNFEPQIGAVFTGMFLIAFLLAKIDKSRTFILERFPGKRFQSLAFGIAAYGILLFSSAIINPIVQGGGIKINFNTALASLTSTQATIFGEIAPALAQNIVFTALAFAILIPFIETFWLGVTLEKFYDFAGIRKINFRSLFQLKNWRLWVPIGLLASFFTGLHFTSLGITNDTALVNVTLFAIITLVLVIMEGQFLGAILFHVIANAMALAFSPEFANISQPNYMALLILVGSALIIFTSPVLKKYLPFR